MPEFKAKLAREAIREEMALAELSKTVWRTYEPDEHREACGDGEHGHGVHPAGADPGKPNGAETEKLHSKIGQLVVERDFLANASVQTRGTRGKKW